MPGNDYHPHDVIPKFIRRARLVFRVILILLGHVRDNHVEKENKGRISEGRQQVS